MIHGHSLASSKEGASRQHPTGRPRLAPWSPRAVPAAVALAASLVLASPGPSVAQTDNLDPTARYDVLRLKLNTSVRAKTPKETLAIIAEMRKLPQGVKGELIFFEGHAHYQLKDWEPAYRSLVEYLNTVGRKGRNYNLAITLFINTERALKAARQGGAERERAGHGWAAASAAFDRANKIREFWKAKAITFGGPKDDTAWAMARRAGGGILVAGTFHQPEDKKNKRKESRSLGMIALNRDGRMAWNRVILGTAKDGAVRSATALPGGGFLLGGIYRGRAVAVRIDKNAVPIPNHAGKPWVSAYAGIKDGEGPVVLRSTGGTIVAIGAETVTKDGTTARLPYTLRLAEDGKALGKTFYSGNATRFWHDIADAAAMPNGDIIAVGEARAQAAWDTRAGMGFLLRVTSEGRLVWAHRTPSQDKSDVRYSTVVPTKGGGIIAGGRQGQRLLLLKTRPDGRQEWLKTIPYRDLLPAAAREICAVPALRERIAEAQKAANDPVPDADRVAAVRQAACQTGTPFLSVASIIARQKGYLVLGFQGRGNRKNTDIRLIAIDGKGTVLWDKIYGHDGFDLATSGLATEDDGVILAGATDSMGAGGRDFLMFKVDARGDFAPWRQLGPPVSPTGKRAAKHPGPASGNNSTPQPKAAVNPPSAPSPKSQAPEKKAEASDQSDRSEQAETPDRDWSVPAPGQGGAMGSDESDDTSIGSIFGSIFGGGDPKGPASPGGR